MPVLALKNNVAVVNHVVQKQSSVTQFPKPNQNKSISNASFKLGNSAPDIDEQKQSVESWLNSHLGVQGSCKPIIEAHLAERCQGRSEAERKFKWDIFLLLIYLFFLIFYSISACNSDGGNKLQVRKLLEPKVGNFQGVQSIGTILIIPATCHFELFEKSKHLQSSLHGKYLTFALRFSADIYSFLEDVIIPSVSEGGICPIKDLSMFPDSTHIF
jgi:hypothetical protein